MADKVVMETRSPVVFNREDNGYTLQYPITNPIDLDDPFVIVLQSHEEPSSRNKPSHTLARRFAGKKVRVTVEVID
jgi:hypothetical protein